MAGYYDALNAVQIAIANNGGSLPTSLVLAQAIQSTGVSTIGNTVFDTAAAIDAIINGDNASGANPTPMDIVTAATGLALPDPGF